MSNVSIPQIAGGKQEIADNNQHNQFHPLEQTNKNLQQMLNNVIW